MPRLQKLYHLEITVEQFLDACDATELQEVDLLIGTAKYRAKMNGSAEVSKDSRYHGKFKQLQIPD
jgi:hypothetical protein